MSANQKIILTIFVIYLALNAIIGIVFSKRQGSKQNVSSEKKFFIGGRNMNGLLLAMTTMATYTSVSSFISGPGAAGLTYGYAQAWIATVQVPGTLISFWVLVGFGTLGLPQTAVRSMGFKNTKSLHSAMWIGALTCSFIIVGMHMAGTWAGALVDTNNLPTSDYFIPYIVQKIMPVGLAGTFLAAPMAAVMSTADSLLILASAAIVKDLWRNYVVKDNPEKIASYNKNVGKLSTLVTFAFGVVVILLTINPPDIIFFLNLFALGGLECSFFWPLIGGLFWKKGTKQAAISSSIGAAATYVFCYYNVHVAGINAVVWGLLAGAILYFAVGKATSKNGLDADIIKNCF